MSQDQFLRVTDKVQQLLKKFELLQRENERTRKDLIDAHEKLDAQSKKIQALEQTIAALKTVSGNIDEANKKDIEKRLNQYLKEIDRCISMLGE
jgi:C4-dicarboxylate-specific signal transduction histidine kinase